jgi:hypothetical protein
MTQSDNKMAEKSFFSAFFVEGNKKLSIFAARNTAG